MFQRKRTFYIVLIVFVLLILVPFVLSGPGMRGVTYALPRIFGPETPYTVGNAPAGVAVGNFMGKGRQDLAVTNQGDDTVSILSNDGSGAFTVKSPIHVGSSPIGIVTGNFSGQGYADLAVANFADNTVTVLLNDGNGKFTAKTPISVGDHPSRLAVGNFMGKGQQDLAVTNQFDDTVNILANNGSGTFTVSSSTWLSNINDPEGGYTPNPVGIVAGDFSGQGHADLAVADIGDNTVSILTNNGNGSFSVKSFINVGQGPLQIVTGNFSGRGRADLAVTNVSDGTVDILSNDGSGNFTVGSPISVGQGPGGIAVGTFGGKENADLAVANVSDSTINILTNDGSGNFTVGSPISVGQDPSSLAVGNFSGQGHSDLAVTNSGDNTVDVLLYMFSPPPSPTGPPPLPDVAIKQTHTGGGTLHVGQKVSEMVSVSLTTTSGPITQQNSIHVVETIPTGLSNIAAVGTGWSISITGNTSPALVSAIYTGAYPLFPGTNLPSLIISGVINTRAGASFTDTATVRTPGDSDQSNNLATDTFAVSRLPWTVTPVPSPTSMPTSGISPTAAPPFTPIALPTTLPSCAMELTHVGGATFHSGESVTSLLTVTNTSKTIAIDAQTPIRITVVIPLGMTNVQIVGRDWFITSSSKVSPLIFTAYYTGVHPIVPGQTLPSLLFTGTLTPDAVPALINTALVSVNGNATPDDTMATDTIIVVAGSTRALSGGRMRMHQANGRDK